MPYGSASHHPPGDGVVSDLTVAENIFLGELPARRLGPLNARAPATSSAGSVSDFAPARARTCRSPTSRWSDGKGAVAGRPGHRLRRAHRRAGPWGTPSGSSNHTGPRREGVGIVYISHRLDEIYAIADRVTVMKDGRRVDTVSPDAVPMDRLIRMMVGRPLSQLFGQKPHTTIGEELLRIEGLTLPNLVRDVSFSLRRGEIVGLGDSSARAGPRSPGRSSARMPSRPERSSSRGRPFVRVRPSRPFGAAWRSSPRIARDRAWCSTWRSARTPPWPTPLR